MFEEVASEIPIKFARRLFGFYKDAHGRVFMNSGRGKRIQSTILLTYLPESEDGRKLTKLILNSEHKWRELHRKATAADYNALAESFEKWFDKIDVIQLKKFCTTMIFPPFSDSRTVKVVSRFNRIDNRCVVNEGLVWNGGWHPEYMESGSCKEHTEFEKSSDVEPVEGKTTDVELIEGKTTEVELVGEKTTEVELIEEKTTDVPKLHKTQKPQKIGKIETSEEEWDSLLWDAEVFTTVKPGYMLFEYYNGDVLLQQTECKLAMKRLTIVNKNYYDGKLKEVETEYLKYKRKYISNGHDAETLEMFESV